MSWRSVLSLLETEQYRVKKTANEAFFNMFIALSCTEGLTSGLFSGPWPCSKLDPGWWRSACLHWLRWRPACCADPPGSPQTWWALCSWSRRTPRAAHQGRCSCRPESSCRSRWTAPSKEQGGSLEVWRNRTLSKPVDLKMRSPTIRYYMTKSHSQRRWPAAWQAQRGPWTWQSHWWS